MNRQRFSILSVLFIILAICTTVTAPAFSADVTLSWDPNNPVPEGYRVFARQSGQGYNYAHPIWENSEVSCKLTGLVEGVTYYFVVRAYEGTLESPDSDEVSYTPDATVSHQLSATDDEANSGSDQITDKGYSIINDLDGDGVPDLLDRFPDDPTEWTDNDSDGLGDNGDPDDDNDGMTDLWETIYGLDPITNDAALDADGDGVERSYDRTNQYRPRCAGSRYDRSDRTCAPRHGITH